MSAKLLYSKIAAVCHPDKTNEVKLHAIMNQANQVKGDEEALKRLHRQVKRLVSSKVVFKGKTTQTWLTSDQLNDVYSQAVSLSNKLVKRWKRQYPEVSGQWYDKHSVSVYNTVGFEEDVTLEIELNVISDIFAKSKLSAFSADVVTSLTEVVDNQNLYVLDNKIVVVLPFPLENDFLPRSHFLILLEQSTGIPSTIQLISSLGRLERPHILIGGKPCLIHNPDELEETNLVVKTACVEWTLSNQQQLLDYWTGQYEDTFQLLSSLVRLDNRKQLPYGLVNMEKTNG